MGPRRDDIRRMFDAIAHRYDCANAVLSGGLHFWWRRLLLRRTGRGEAALDVCTGTGGLLRPLQRRFHEAVGVDLSHRMLLKARTAHLEVIQADAEHLPFPNGKFSVVTVAWGIRNIQNLDAALREMRRVLHTGGRVVILEFGGTPRGLWGKFFGWYSRSFLPILGGMLTGNRQAYRYLNSSSVRFPGGEALAAVLRSAGFSSAQWRPLAGGVAYLYEASKVSE